jgi:hypothetical protein
MGQTGHCQSRALYLKEATYDSRATSAGRLLEARIATEIIPIKRPALICIGAIRVFCGRNQTEKSNDKSKG